MFYCKKNITYVHWLVCWLNNFIHSWIKIDHLDVTCFIISLFTAQHVSNVSTSIFRSTVDLFHVLYCSGSMCIGVTVWFGWGGVVSLCRLKQCFMLSSKYLNNKTSDIKLVYVHSTIKMMHGPINIKFPTRSKAVRIITRAINSP